MAGVGVNTSVMTNAGNGFNFVGKTRFRVFIVNKIGYDSGLVCELIKLYY